MRIDPTSTSGPTYGDIQRCPYAPHEAGYAEWTINDTLRLVSVVGRRQLELARHTCPRCGDILEYNYGTWWQCRLCRVWCWVKL